MRSRQQDQTGLVVFSGRFDGTAASGNGIAGSIPFVFTRTGTGAYTINFDAALMPTAFTASSATGMTVTVGQGIGTLYITTYNTTGTPTSPGIVHFTVTARDGRR